ncbi:hypothetical protein Bca4012_080213 [Brassica carinata]
MKALVSSSAELIQTLVDVFTVSDTEISADFKAVLVFVKILVSTLKAQDLQNLRTSNVKFCFGRLFQDIVLNQRPRKTKSQRSFIRNNCQTASDTNRSRTGPNRPGNKQNLLETITSQEKKNRFGKAL